MTVAFCLVKVVPFRIYCRLLGQEGIECDREADLSLLQRVVWAVKFADRLFLRRSACLSQAITGKWLLQRRQVASTLYLGVALQPQAGIKAHAWLRCGSYIVTGGAGREEFSVVARFT